MKHTRKNNSESKVTLSVILDASDLELIKPKTIARLSKKLKVSGFRPGKIPANVAEKNLDANLLGMEIAEDAINKFIVDVLEAEKIQPLDRPKIDFKKYVPGEVLEFVAELDILPEVTLGDYKNLKVKKESVKIDEKGINSVIERMRSGMATKNEVERAAKNGDEAVIDFEGTKDGKEVPGATGKDYPLQLGSNSFIPGFEEGVVGKKTGDKFDLPLTFPKDYHHKPLAGEKVNFAVTIKKINAVELPKLDDEFAAKCGPFKTVEDLKSDVKRELEAQKQRELDDKLKDQLIEQLVKNSKIPTPDILIDDQTKALEQDFTQNLMYRGMTLDQYLSDQSLTKEDWVKNELREQAIRRVQVGLVLAELSKAEKIEVTLDELNVRLDELMQQYGNDQKIREQLDTPEVRRDLANRLITEKTVDKLVKLNK
ncbi:MAG: trigger factor [Candidatus Woesebacteria bacterium]|jgi:trigger factor